MQQAIKIELFLSPAQSKMIRLVVIQELKKKPL